MSLQQLLAVLCLNLMTHLGLDAGQASSDVSPKDIVDGYKLNYHNFHSLRVAWRQWDRKGEQWFRTHEGRILGLERMAKAAPSEEVKAQCLSQAKAYREMLDLPDAKKASLMHFDFWTDRQRFQIRRVSNKLEWGGGRPVVPDDFTFPDEPLNPSTLQTAFKDISILSFNGDLTSGFRYWDGRRRQGSHTGVVYSQAPEYTQSWLFPPLAVDTKVWGQVDAWHEIDRFFLTLPVEKMSVRGMEKIGNKRTYALTCTEIQEDMKKVLAPALAEKYQGKAQTIKRTTAWVDPSQGFLPLKIEWDAYWVFKDGGESNSTYTGRPGRRLVLERIEQFAGAGAYPVRGVVQSLVLVRTIEELSELVGLQFDSFLRSKPKQGETGIYEESRWEAVKVEANGDLDRGMFDLTFPHDTVYYDETRQKGFSTTDPGKLIDGAVVGTTEPAAPVRSSSWHWRTALIVLNVAGATALVIAYRLLRRREKVK